MSTQPLCSCSRISTSWITMKPMLWIVAALIPVVVSLNSKSNNSGIYIVHTALSEMPSVFQNPKSWYVSTLELVRSPGTQTFNQKHLVYVYEVASHGFAAKLSEKHIASLEKLPGFLSVVPDSLLQLQTTYTPQFMGLDTTEGLWTDANYGEDVIVGVIDTGVWPESQSFNDEGFGPVPARWKGKCEAAENFDPSKCCNKKLIGARAFSSGFGSVSDSFSKEEQQNSPRDVLGHGTHTASTIAGAPVRNASFLGYAAGTARGISPRARVAVYKACWGSGQCMMSDVLRALDQAVADGVDIVSLSLGGVPRPFYQDPIAVGTFGAAEKGVIVSCAAGNDGPTSGSVINVAPWQLTVAASTVDRDFPATVKLGNGATYVGGSLYDGKGLGEEEETELIYGGDSEGGSCLEGQLDEEKVRGKIVVCKNGDEGPMAVKMAGGAGVIVVQREAYGVDVVAASFPLPGATVCFGDGMAIIQYASGGSTPKSALFFNGTAFGRRCAPAVMGFSSRGPNPIAPEILKPDIAAPGLNILAAWSAASSAGSASFKLDSGTSMSCPHATGLSALLRAAHPDWSAAAIKSALMTSALTSDRCLRPIQDSFTSSHATPFHFGAGHVNSQAAHHPGLVYDLSIQDYVDYLCRLNYSQTQLRLFTKDQYVCPPKDPAAESFAAHQLNYPAISIVLHASSGYSPSVADSPLLFANVTRTVTNVGAPNAVYIARVMQPAGTTVKVVPGELVFRETGQKLSFVVIIAPNKRRSRLKELGGHSFGWLSWIEKERGQMVRTPLVITWRSV